MKTATLLDSESENDQREEDHQENVAVMADGMECMWFIQKKQLVRNRDEGVQLEVNVGIDIHEHPTHDDHDDAPFLHWKALSIGLILEKPDFDRIARWGLGPDEEGYIEERSFSGFLDEVVCLQWR